MHFPFCIMISKSKNLHVVAERYAEMYRIYFKEIHHYQYYCYHGLQVLGKEIR